MSTIANTDKRDYSKIYKDTPGFQHIADAIHFRTVQLLSKTKNPNPQYQRKSSFNVLYGLDADLLQQAHNSDAFVDALGKFVASYRWEREKVKTDNTYDEWPGPEITDEDFYQVVDLIPEFGSRVVARMLVAAGYTGRPRSDTSDSDAS